MRNVNVAAGQFAFDVVDDGGVYRDSTLNAYGIDVNHNLVSNSSVQYTWVDASASTYLNSEQRSLISQLFDAHARSLGDAASDAAFQLSLWEIMYAFSSGALDPLIDNFSCGALSGGRSLAR